MEGNKSKLSQASPLMIISNLIALILVIIAVFKGFMNGKHEHLMFLVINIIALVAVLLNVGFTEDNYSIKTKKFTKQGKVALGVWLFSLAGLLTFLGRHVYKIYTNQPYEIDTNIYLGYLITAMAYFLPFISTPHDNRIKGWPKIGLTGWLIVILGFSGMMSSVFKLLEFASDYLTVTGHFITVASSIMAISGETIHTDDRGTAHLTDLGKLSLAVIITGFAISIINSQIEDKENEEVRMGIKHANKELAASQELIDTLKQNIKEVDTLLAPVKGELEDITVSLLEVIDKIGDTRNTLTNIEDGVSQNKSDLEGINDELTNNVAQKTEIANVQRVIDANQLNIQSMQQQVFTIKSEIDSNVAKKEEILDVKHIVEVNQRDLETMQIDVTNVKNDVANNMVKKDDLEAIEAGITGNSTKIDNIKTKVDNDLALRTDVQTIETAIKDNAIEIQEVHSILSENTLGKSDLQAVQNEVGSIRSQIDSLKTSINIPGNILQKNAFDQKISELENKLNEVINKLNNLNTSSSNNSNSGGSDEGTDDDTNDDDDGGGE